MPSSELSVAAEADRRSAVVKAKAMNDVPPIALAVVLMFPVDLAVSLWGAVLAASGRAPVWR